MRNTISVQDPNQSVATFPPVRKYSGNFELIFDDLIDSKQVTHARPFRKCQTRSQPRVRSASARTSKAQSALWNTEIE